MEVVYELIRNLVSNELCGKINLKTRNCVYSVQLRLEVSTENNGYPGFGAAVMIG